jgi:hypothetical protein
MVPGGLNDGSVKRRLQIKLVRFSCCFARRAVFNTLKDIQCRIPDDSIHANMAILL